jgi:hypothetical protein
MSVAVVMGPRVAEIQEFHLAFVVHQHVGRLDVAVNDQIRMRVGNGAKNIQKEFDSRIYIELARIAILIDLFSLHMLKDEIGLSFGGHARVNQLRDVGVRNLAENPPLALESFSRSA